MVVVLSSCRKTRGCVASTRRAAPLSSPPPRANTRPNKLRGNTMKMLQTLAYAALAVGLLVGVSTARADDDVIRFGITAPMSGAAASWGIGADWVGQQAVKWIN